MPTLPWHGVTRPSTTMPATTRNLPQIFEPHPKKTKKTKNRTRDYKINTTYTQGKKPSIHRNGEK